MLAQANVPSDIAAGLAMARLTALRNPDGGVRGIATGDVFRRPVSRSSQSWAKQSGEATSRRPKESRCPGHSHRTPRLRAPVGGGAHVGRSAGSRSICPCCRTLQCSWLLFSMCATPRANHALRTLPPAASGGYAQAHDAACMGGFGDQHSLQAWAVATLPAAHGGLRGTHGARPPQRTGRPGQMRCP